MNKPLFTPEELAELEAIDAAIDEEFERGYVADEVDKEITEMLEQLAIEEELDRKQIHRRRKKRAYYEAHKDEIAEKMRAYREAHKDEIAEYQKAYQRDYRKGIRRKQHVVEAKMKKAANESTSPESGSQK